MVIVLAENSPVGRSFHFAVSCAERNLRDGLSRKMKLNFLCTLICSNF